MTVNPAMARILARKLSEIIQSDDFYGVGLCTACGENSEDYCEPDTQEARCTACGCDSVYGIEELLIDIGEDLGIEI